MPNPSDDDNRTISYPGHGVGLRNVGSYQVSGHPFLTGSTGVGVAAGTETKVSFPFVTKSVTVISSGSFNTPTVQNSLKVHFNPASDGNVLGGQHYITLDSEEDSMTFNVKCKEIYLTTITVSASYQLFAELTNISAGSMYDLTGSGLTD